MTDLLNNTQTPEISPTLAQPETIEGWEQQFADKHNEVLDGHSIQGDPLVVTSDQQHWNDFAQQADTHKSEQELRLGGATRQVGRLPLSATAKVEKVEINAPQAGQQ